MSPLFVEGALQVLFLGIFGKYDRQVAWETIADSHLVERHTPVCILFAKMGFRVSEGLTDKSSIWASKYPSDQRDWFMMMDERLPILIGQQNELGGQACFYSIVVHNTITIHPQHVHFPTNHSNPSTSRFIWSAHFHLHFRPVRHSFRHGWNLTLPNHWTRRLGHLDYASNARSKTKKHIHDKFNNLNISNSRKIKTHLHSTGKENWRCRFGLGAEKSSEW